MGKVDRGAGAPNEKHMLGEVALGRPLRGYGDGVAPGALALQARVLWHCRGRYHIGWLVSVFQRNSGGKATQSGHLDLGLGP